MVVHAGSPTHIVHVDVTLARCKFKVTGLLKFQKLHFSRSIFSAILAWTSKLMVDHDTARPNVQPVGTEFSNFLLRKLSREFRLCRMSV